MQTLLPKRIVAKPWGRTDIGAFETQRPGHGTRCATPVGEIWFEPGSGAVLVKYLFTSQRLSIQVHPDDEQAHVKYGVRGKDECWLVLEAAPDAVYGIGFSRDVTRAELKDATLDGSIVDLLDWHQARVGEFIFNPANTVHALGPGLTVLEVQQNSDVTLRLFDYGSDRPLHIDEAVAIARRVKHHHPLDTHIDFTRSQILVDGPKFGLAYCNAHVPRLPRDAHAVHLVTWRDEIKVGGQPVPPGSMIAVDDLRDIGATFGQQFFVVWASERCGSDKLCAT